MQNTDHVLEQYMQTNIQDDNTNYQVLLSHAKRVSVWVGPVYLSGTKQLLHDD